MEDKLNQFIPWLLQPDLPVEVTDITLDKPFEIDFIIQNSLLNIKVASSLCVTGKDMAPNLN